MDEGREAPEPTAGDTKGEVSKRDPNEGAPPGVQRFFIKDSPGAAKRLLEKLREGGSDPDVLQSSQWRRDALAKNQVPSDPAKSDK